MSEVAKKWIFGPQPEKHNPFIEKAEAILPYIKSAAHVVVLEGEDLFHNAERAAEEFKHWVRLEERNHEIISARKQAEAEAEIEAAEAEAKKSEDAKGIVVNPFHNDPNGPDGSI